jgi:hypothetical protein
MYEYVGDNPVKWIDSLGLSSQKADCIECRLKVVYQGWQWFSLVTDISYYYESTLTSVIPLAINRGWIQEQTIKRIELQAKVNSANPPCCCTAKVEGKITATKEIPMILSHWEFNPKAALYGAIGAISTSKVPSIGIYGAVLAAYVAFLAGVNYQIRRSERIITGKEKIGCTWKTIATDLNLGRIPSTRAIIGNILSDKKTICQITRIFGAYPSVSGNI